ncbi:hypothetical protein SAMN05443245_5674 [Paraburkholderia fungorum]|uniref:Uncharacterized protein n=1 Tax=Paraburkholderia fungorum TaxID=134537 RepID=A0A1H1ITX1_9BURK|nr:hypothetical protein [Paraburkholderia fungorum]SDR41175.1 hypothetical protein SAMN05443245_5674 [Paraburkholderia fungorum]
MAVGYFVNGVRVNPHAPGNLLSANALTHLHGDDFIREFGADMFRRLPLEQQAAVIGAWSKANSDKAKERSEVFEALLAGILCSD